MCISAWLNEKTGLSESVKTHAAYEETLSQFRDLLTTHGLDLDAATSLVFPGRIEFGQQRRPV